MISKSGGTPETRNGMLEVQAACERQGVPFAPQAVAVTSAGSRLDRLASDVVAGVDTRTVKVELPIADAVDETTAEVDDLGPEHVAIERVGAVPVRDGDDDVVELEAHAADSCRTHACAPQEPFAVAVDAHR